MTKFTFFVRNVVINKRVNADYIFRSIDGGEPMQTCFIAHNEKSTVARANELAAVAHHEKWGEKVSEGYFAALKTFMVMGFNSDFDYVWDGENVMPVIR